MHNAGGGQALTVAFFVPSKIPHAHIVREATIACAQGHTSKVLAI